MARLLCAALAIVAGLIMGSGGAASKPVAAPPATTTSLNAVAFVDARTGFVGGAGTILATTAGGQTWTVRYPAAPGGGASGPGVRCFDAVPWCIEGRFLAYDLPPSSKHHGPPEAPW